MAFVHKQAASRLTAAHQQQATCGAPLRPAAPAAGNAAAPCSALLPTAPSSSPQVCRGAWRRREARPPHLAVFVVPAPSPAITPHPPQVAQAAPAASVKRASRAERLVSRATPAAAAGERGGSKEQAAPTPTPSVLTLQNVLPLSAAGRKDPLDRYRNIGIMAHIDAGKVGGHTHSAPHGRNQPVSGLHTPCVPSAPVCVQPVHQRAARTVMRPFCCLPTCRRPPHTRWACQTWVGRTPYLSYCMARVCTHTHAWRP